jgi:hypothetical protein
MACDLVISLGDFDTALELLEPLCRNMDHAGRVAASCSGDNQG